MAPSNVRDATKTQWLSPLLLQRIPAEERWILYGPLKLYSRKLRRILLVEPGFETDFASIPRLLWRILPKNGKWDGAAVLHDAVYRGVLDLTKQQGDDLFNEVMILDKVPRWQRWALYRGVQLFGGHAYTRGHTTKGGSHAQVASPRNRGRRDAPQGQGSD